jgi:polysaccharide pyruvyl transferase WcaK-like protein
MKGGNAVERIGLFGPWGYGNLGCAATVEATIQNIQTYRPNAELVCFSLYPDDTEQRHAVRAYPIGRGVEDDEAGDRDSLSMRLAGWLQSRRSPLLQRAARLARRVPLEMRLIRRTYRRLEPLDLIIVAGGGQLLDFWGGAFTHPYWLLKYAVLARLARTELIFLSVGAGPLDSRLSRLFCRAALWLSSYRSYRDESSKQFVRSRVGFRRDDPVYPDLAYSLRPNQHGHVGTRRRVVGLGVMAWFDPRHWPENDVSVYRGYVEQLVAFARWLIERGYVVSLIVGESRWDRTAVDDFLAILGQWVDLGQEDPPVRNDAILTVDALLDQIDQADFVVASRLHNVLLSTFLSKPVIALSYHPKIDALMDEAGQASYCLPIRELDVEALKDRFLDLEANRDAIEQHFTEMTAGRRVALQEQYEHIFGELDGPRAGTERIRRATATTSSAS